jgi:hypothetical protein
VITFFREINTSKSKSKARRKTASAPYDYVEGCTRERRENNSKKYPLFSLSHIHELFLLFGRQGH